MYAHQRSGWGYALDALAPLLRGPGPGILFDSMLERNFARDRAEARAEGRIPYRRPWIGFFHVPAEIPGWFDPTKSVLRIATLPEWQESLPHCRGLMTLSRHHAAFLRSMFPSVPVLALRHPTAMAEPRFALDRYLREGQRVVQVGWWLRRMASIHFLPVVKARKKLLLPVGEASLPRYLRALEGEREADGAPELASWDARSMERLPDAEYDALLASSVVLLHLRGSVANNAILECMVQGTPVLVNPLPSVREYLGDDYPLYFDDLEEAARKASDPERVLEAHRYLSARDLEPLTGAAFCRDLAESELYRSLPAL